MSKIPEKFNLPKIEHFFYFVVLLAILSASAFFLLAVNFKSYQGDVSILLIPKNAMVSAQSEQILENLAELPRQLSFYDKLLKDGSFNDPFSGLSKDQRKKLWNNKLEVERANQGTIINIGITAENRAEALATSRQAAHTLFNSVSRYYNIKTEVDLRIIDGPIAKPIFSNWPWLALASLLLGTLLSYFAITVLQKISELFEAQKFNLFRKKFPQKETEKLADFIPVPPIRKFPATVKKYSAPENLPVAPDEYPLPEEYIADNGVDIAENEEEIEEYAGHTKISDKPEKGEPTEDELKERLNQLLRGEF